MLADVSQSQEIWILCKYNLFGEAFWKCGVFSAEELGLNYGWAGGFLTFLTVLREIKCITILIINIEKNHIINNIIIEHFCLRISAGPGGSSPSAAQIRNPGFLRTPTHLSAPPPRLMSVRREAGSDPGTPPVRVTQLCVEHHLHSLISLWTRKPFFPSDDNVFTCKQFLFIYIYSILSNYFTDSAVTWWWS